MEHKNLPGQPQMPEFERTWNCQPADPHINSGTAAFTLHVENFVARSLNSVQSSITGRRMDACPVPNYHPDVSNHISNSNASSYVPFVRPFAGISPQFPSEYVQHVPYYNETRANDGSATSNSQMDYYIATRKRKFQATVDVGRGNIDANYYVRSSSNFPSSAEHTHTIPMLGSQYSYWDHSHFVPNHRSNNILPPEGSQRNVRRHYGVHLGTSSDSHSSRNAPNDIHSGANTLGPIVAGLWSQNPVPWIAHANLVSSVPGNGIFNREMGHPHGMGYVSGSVGVAETYNFAPNHCRNSMPSPFPTGPSTRAVITGRDSFNQRTDRATNVNNSPNGQAVSSVIAPPWCLRPIEIGDYNVRNGRVRSHYDRLSASTDEYNARSRWVSEGVSMMDHSAYGDSRILYDRHHEMRVDIDNMTYEELLALGERIGCVSTGLSEDAVSKCLTETAYGSDHIPDDADHNCAICLEAYEEQEQVGRLNCKHDFHASCIRKWLLIKNVCPICKTSAWTEQ